METEKAKGANKDFAVLAAMKKRLKASRVLDITAHKEQLECAARVAELNARVAELNAQYPGAVAAAEAADDYERCAALTREKEAAAAQLRAGRVRLEAATGVRAKEWEAEAAALEAEAAAAEAARVAREGKCLKSV
jgi:hypothetical protein